MQPKTALIPCCGKEDNKNALRYAQIFADAFDTKEIQFLSVMPDYGEYLYNPYMASAISQSIAEKMAKDLEKDALEEVKKIHSAFEKTIEEDSRFKWVAKKGNRKELTIASSQLADVVILDQSIEKICYDNAGMVSDMLFGSGRPIILLPEVEQPSFDKIAIAWDGSPRAAKSMAASLDILKQANEVLVFTVLEDESSDQPHADDVVDYLDKHDIAATHHEINYRVNVGDSLMRACQNHDINLLVMGAYGHSKLAEMVLGGATRYMLKKAHIPVFMVH